jgi:hypothetical protein
VTTTTDLTTSEQSELEHYEAIIARGFQVFVEVGNALIEIRDRRLYRTTHRTFADYCRERWDMSRQRAYQLIDASEVAQDLSTIVDISTVPESHLRPLSALPPEERPAAWQEANDRAGNGTRTAAHVEQVVRARRDAAPADAALVPLDPPLVVGQRTDIHRPDPRLPPPPAPEIEPCALPDDLITALRERGAMWTASWREADGTIMHQVRGAFLPGGQESTLHKTTDGVRALIAEMDRHPVPPPAAGSTWAVGEGRARAAAAIKRAVATLPEPIVRLLCRALAETADDRRTASQAQRGLVDSVVTGLLVGAGAKHDTNGALLRAIIGEAATSEPAVPNDDPLAAIRRGLNQVRSWTTQTRAPTLALIRYHQEMLLRLRSGLEVLADAPDVNDADYEEASRQISAAARALDEVAERGVVLALENEEVGT